MDQDNRIADPANLIFESHPIKDRTLHASPAVTLTSTPTGSSCTNVTAWQRLVGSILPEATQEYSSGVQQRPLTAASEHDRQHTELAGTTGKRPAPPLVRDEEAVPLCARSAGQHRVLAVTPG